MPSLDLNLVLMYVQYIYPDDEVMGIQRIKTPDRNRFLVTYSNRTLKIDIEYSNNQRPSFLHIF